jgi:hypothetical protein
MTFEEMDECSSRLLCRVARQAGLGPLMTIKRRLYALYSFRYSPMQMRTDHDEREVAVEKTSTSPLIPVPSSIVFRPVHVWPVLKHLY